MLRNFFVMMLAALGLMACESEPGETSTGTVTTSSGTGGNTSGGGTNGTGSGTNGGTGGSGTLDQGLLVTVYVPNVATDNTWDGEWVETDGVPVQVYEEHRTNLENAYLLTSGESGSLIGLEDEDYTITIGSLDKRCEANDWLAVHTSDNGWSWIAPSYEIEVTYGDVVELDVYMNAFAEGEWSCHSEALGDIDSGDVIYHNGDEVEFVNQPSLKIHGLDVSYSDEYDATGSFVSSDLVQFDISGGLLGTDSVECWLGSANSRP